MENQTGIDQPLLHVDKCPDVIVYIWDWFLEISAARSENKPIPYSEIKAWADLSGVKISYNELQIIKMLDNLVLEANQDG